MLKVYIKTKMYTNNYILQFNLKHQMYKMYLMSTSPHLTLPKKLDPCAMWDRLEPLLLQFCWGLKKRDEKNEIVHDISQVGLKGRGRVKAACFTNINIVLELLNASSVSTCHVSQGNLGSSTEWKTLQNDISIKMSCHIQFTQAFAALQYNFKAFTLVGQNKLSTQRMHRRDVLTRLYAILPFPIYAI